MGKFYPPGDSLGTDISRQFTKGVGKMGNSDRRTLEHEVEEFLRQEVKKVGGQCYKLMPNSARGLPDRLAVFPDGTVIWVELKRPVGGRLSVAQRVEHERLRRLGQWVEVASTKDAVDRILEQWKGKQREAEGKSE